MKFIPYDDYGNCCRPRSTGLSFRDELGGTRVFDSSSLSRLTLPGGETNARFHSDPIWYYFVAVIPTSDLVFVNVATHPIRPALYFYDKEGNPIAAESVVDVTGDLEVQGDGGLTVQTAIEPLGELTISTHGQGELVSGSVKVIANGPIGGVLRFDLPGVGVAGVGASPPVSDALFPARRQAGGISTAVAIHNLGEEAMVVSCRLMKGGAVLEEAEIPLEANGQDARFIEEVFTRTDTSDFVGSVRCTAPGEGAFTGVAVELDASNQIFTTLPVVPVPETPDRE